MTTRHDRAVRGRQSYQTWAKWAEFIDTHQTPEILRLIWEAFKPTFPTHKDDHKESLELFIKDKYTTFAVLERMRGKEG